MHQLISVTSKNNESVDIQRKIIFYLPMFWIILGVIEVFSSSRYASELIKHSKYFLVSLHIAWIILSVIAVFIFIIMSPKIVMKFAKFFLWANILALFFTFITGKINGSARWVSVFGFTLQPSEFLKITLPLYLSNYFSTISKLEIKSYEEHIKKELLPLFINVALPLLLVLLQPDLSTFLLISLEVGVMYFLLAKNYVLLDVMILGGSFMLLFLASVSFVHFRKSRLAVYLNLLKYGKIIDPYGAGNQILNILIAVGSGGLLGKGIGHSSQVGGYLVESTAATDSIGAVLFEELGFVGGTLIVLSYLFWAIITINNIIKRDTSPYGVALISIVFLFTLQAFIHFGVNVGLLPLTGVALPFISYGGSATLSSMWMLALILGFFKHT